MHHGMAAAVWPKAKGKVTEQTHYGSLDHEQVDDVGLKFTKMNVFQNEVRFLGHEPHATLDKLLCYVGESSWAWVPPQPQP